MSEIRRKGMPESVAKLGKQLVEFRNDADLVAGLCREACGEIYINTLFIPIVTLGRYR